MNCKATPSLFPSQRLSIKSDEEQAVGYSARVSPNRFRMHNDFSVRWLIKSFRVSSRAPVEQRGAMSSISNRQGQI